MKKENEAIKDRIIRDIRNLFKHEEEDCYEPVREVIFGVTVILKMKAVVIEIRNYHLKNIFTKLDHT